GKVIKQTRGPVTLTDHERSYELVEGEGWHQLVAFDLTTGLAVWLADLGTPPIDEATLADGGVWIVQNGVRRGFAVRDGRERSPKSL
ncbi:MAG: hypothetical protein H0V17_11675, partial [Deltaproteobacteria bacterium]|nr:hypothetical protein [Deltaproteobacteria bacterium]